MWLVFVASIALGQPPAPSPGACWGAGVWTPDGEVGPLPDDCNRGRCQAGEWVSTTLLSCEVAIAEKVHFPANVGAVSERSGDVLDAIAEVLVAQPDLRVTVVGHRSTEEAAELSAARMQAVHAALVTRGVPTLQLTTEDAGDTRPLATEPEANRRVDFHVVRAEPPVP